MEEYNCNAYVKPVPREAIEKYGEKMTHAVLIDTIEASGDIYHTLVNLTPDEKTANLVAYRLNAWRDQSSQPKFTQ